MALTVLDDSPQLRNIISNVGLGNMKRRKQKQQTLNTFSRSKNAEFPPDGSIRHYWWAYSRVAAGPNGAVSTVRQPAARSQPARWWCHCPSVRRQQPGHPALATAERSITTPGHLAQQLTTLSPASHPQISATRSTNSPVFKHSAPLTHSGHFSLHRRLISQSSGRAQPLSAPLPCPRLAVCTVGLARLVTALSSCGFRPGSGRGLRASPAGRRRLRLRRRPARGSRRPGRCTCRWAAGTCAGRPCSCWRCPGRQT